MSLRGKRQPKSSGGIFSVYCGLGESFGAPKHATDKLCQEHDDNYKLISEQGHNPYFDYNWADELFLEGLEKIVPQSKREVFVGKIAQMVFKGEKLIFQKAAYEEGEDHKRKRLEPQTPPRKSQKLPPTIDPKEKIKATQRYIEYGVDGEGNIHRDFRDPLFNLPSSSQVTTGDKAVATGIMPEGTGSGNTPGLSETPIDTVMDVHRGPPHYSFSSLPYIEESNYIQQFINTKDIVYRMTSPYDVPVTTVSSDINIDATGVNTHVLAGTDLADSTITNARWFTFYAGMYKYYHVVSARWTMAIENLNNKPMWVHQYYSNETNPPNTASNQDMMLWPDFESHYVGVTAQFPTSTSRLEANEIQNNIENQETTLANANSNYETDLVVQSRGVHPILKLAGSYRPGQYDHEIRLDENVENWTATDKNPKLSERLGFRFKTDTNSMLLNSVSSSNDQLAFKYRFQIEYLVEFKELKEGLKYPVQRQPITVTIAKDGSSIN